MSAGQSTLTTSQKREYKRQLWDECKRCGICGKDLPGLEKSTLDHIVPMKHGGKDDISNLQLTHAKCNNLKGDKLAYFPPKKKLFKYHGQLIGMINDELKKQSKCLILPIYSL